MAESAGVSINKITPLAHQSLIAYAMLQWDGYKPADHHRRIAAKLQAVQAGKIKRLMIFMPPRAGKSMLVSEYFPAWYIGHGRERQIIHCTYAQELADGFGRKIRNQISDPLFQAIFPGVSLASDSQAANRFSTTTGSIYHAVGAGGPITGRGSHLLLIDDPIKGREDADSEAQRRKLQDWYRSVAYTRLMPGGAIVIIQTRWHTDDLAGWILREHDHEDWDVLSLPAIDETGQALWPDAFPLDRLHEIRKTIGERDWSALYQQQPTVDGGNILKTNWWQLWPKGRKLPKCDHVFVSWDTAYSTQDSKNSAHSAYSIWGVFWDEQEQRYSLILLGAKSGQWDYPELRKQLIALDKEHAPDLHLIEKKASGQSLIQDMKRIGIPVRGYQPDRDKVSRAYAVQAMLESGQIWRPQKQWAEEFMAHLAAFPNGAPPSADFTDTATQAWLYVRNGYWMSGHPDDDGYAQRNKAPVKEPETEEWLEDNEKDIRRGVYG